MINFLKKLITVIFCVSFLSSAFANTEVISDFGVQIEIPNDFSTEMKTPGAYKSWIDKGSSVSLVIIKIPQTQNDIRAAIEEFKNPSASRSFVNGYGNAQLKTLKASNIDCTYDGRAIDTTGAGSVVRFEVRILCEQSPEYNSIQRIVLILTKSGQLMIRLDSRETSDILAKRLFDAISNSISINASSQISADSKIDSTASVSGGKGIRVVDYGQIKTAALVGSYFGAFFSAILFGYLLSLIFVKLKVPFVFAALSSQVLVILLRIWGAEEDGVWKVDPILYLVTGSVATFVTWKLLKRREEKNLKLNSSKSGTNSRAPETQ